MALSSVNIAVIRTDLTHLNATHQLGGYSWSTICSESELHVDQVQVDFRGRKGQATDLIRATVLSALNIPEGENITHVTADVINPVVPNLIEKVFGAGIAEYFFDTAKTVPIGLSWAVQLIKARQKTYKEMPNDDRLVSGFDDSVKVTIPLNGVDMSKWLPQE